MSSLQDLGAPPFIDPDPDEQEQRVLDQFYAFPFSSDEVFQQGLSAITADESMGQLPASEMSELVLKTKVFYFNRVTGHNIELADVRPRYDNLPVAQNGNECNQTICGAQHGEIRTLAFAELKSLIEQGKTDNIPNNKIVPNTLHDGIPSESTAPLRMKPWEAASQMV